MRHPNGYDKRALAVNEFRLTKEAWVKERNLGVI